jgi:curved DNA-binding protein|tara:strand:- start:7735 stop:8595 length:861 start_codon:yes stop_codon:yes gene_type:complete
MNYYDTLGISRGASATDIKKAYKKQSMQHHPDRTGGDDTKFKDINEAYQVLKDPQKKSMYDQYGTADPQQAGQHNMGDINEVFSQMFGGDMSGQFGDMFGQRRQQRQQRNKTLNINYNLTLEDAYKGKSVVFEIPLPSGRKQTIDTRMPAGIDNGQSIKLRGLGDDSIPNVPPGDLTITARIAKDPRFVRTGCDLHKTIVLTVYELILGCKVEIEHFNQGFLLNVPEGTQPGTVFSMKELGMPILNAPGLGTLYIKVKGTVPKNINDAHKDLIERARLLTKTRKEV